MNETSKLAHEGHAAAAASNRETILSYVRTFPGRTAAEIAAAVRIDRVEVGRRMSEIERAGDIVRGPSRTCSVNHTAMMVWNPVVRRLLAVKEETQTRLF